MIKKEWNGYDELEKEFKPIDKTIIKILGVECKEFCPNCPVCKGYLIYNRFKQDMFTEFS
jgi:hypothetical protein